MVEKRLYQVWPGKNRFLFSGLLIFGPDVKSLLLTVFLIVAPAIVFCVFVGRHLLHEFSNYNSGIAIIVVAGFLTLYVLIILLCTSGRDPGIIPRNPHPPEPEEYDSSASPADWAGGQTPRWRLPRTRDVVVNNVTVKVKYCDTCMLYRPPRCSHCSICNNCVERFDHHCPWVGQCIGKRNYRFFFMFVSSATLLCIYVFAMSALYIKFLMQGDPQTGDTRNVWQAVAKSPASIVLMVYTFIAVWFVGGLSLFHLYLISTNQTTYENFRYRYDSRENPYSLGVIRNFLEVFCSRVEPSKVDFCAKVQVDSSGQRVLNPPPTASIGGNPHIEAKPSWEAGDNEGGHARISGFSDLGLDVKDNFDDNVPHGAGWPLPSEVSEHRTGAHPRRSSWGRKSGSWEITPEILALAVGNTEAGKLDVSHAEKDERLDEDAGTTKS